jgi:hypothetical protein
LPVPVLNRLPLDLTFAVIDADDMLTPAQGEEYEKKKCRGKHIEADGIKVAGSPAFNIFGGQKSRANHQVFDRAEELSVEMGDVVEEVGDDPPDGLLGFQILLSANMAIPPDQGSLTIQADLFLSFFAV